METIKVFALVTESFYATLKTGAEINLSSDVCDMVTSDKATIKEMELHGLLKGVIPVEANIAADKIGFMINWFMKGSEDGGEVPAVFVKRVENDL